MKPKILVALLLGGLLQSNSLLAAAHSKSKKKSAHAAAKTVATKKRVASASLRKKRGPKYKPAPPVDPTLGDNIDGEDLDIRRAAVDALGTLNGSVVVVDPTNGRILTMVNQKLALTGGHTPCSTIKLVTSVAALNEHVVSRETFVPTGRRAGFNLTNALAHSDNQYFSILGNRLGFERVTKYAQMLGLGELAGWNIPGELAGTVPAEAPRSGGMGLLTAFGSGFEVTPLELAALVSAVSNGGTLYYLQYPRTADEIEAFTPRVKRTLEISPDIIDDIKTGMRGAVEFGTARRANYDPTEPILGKTGTCTDFRISTHMGWFGSFNEVNNHKLVVVVMLTGTKTINGPVASGVAGMVYRKLSEQRYFATGSDPAKKNNGLPEIITTYARD